MVSEVGQPDFATPGQLAATGPRSSEIAVALARAGAAAASGSLDEALRWADRAQRLCPESAEIAELKARLLLRLAAAAGALAELLKIDEALRTSAVRALQADAYFALGRDAEGFEVLQAALTSCAVSPGDALAECASRRCGAGRGAPRGWIGLGPDFRAWGRLASGALSTGLSIALSGAAAPAEFQPESERGAEASRAFTAKLVGAGRLTALVQGVPLLGSGLDFPPDVRADGRCFVEDGLLQGWTRLDWAPQVAPVLVVRDRLRELGRVTSKPSADGSGRHEFSFRAPRLRLGRELFVAVSLPDGRAVALPTSPALIEVPPAPGGSRRRGKASAAPVGRPVDVIVPVYEGRAETARCLQSVAATIGGEARLIVVNDASPNAGLVDDLRAFAEQHGATLIEHPRNLGFAAAVNRALQVNPAHDAVILNADAEVFPGWLERLTQAAYSAPDIGTVTPFGEAGAIATYPRNAVRALGSAEAAAIARLAAIANAEQRVEAPTGVGFCLYLRRDCLDETGDLDQRAFGRGYGEENDFCLRAAALGWRHLIATDVFVGHLGARSFGASAAALRERNGRVLGRRHPGYAALVEAFQAADPLHAARRRLDEARLKEMARPFHLLVSLADPGGVDRVLERRCSQIAASGGTPLVLRPEADAELVRLSVPGWEDSDLGYDPDAERAEILSLIAALSPAALELHHYYGHDSTLIDDLIAICGPLTVFVHDYSLVCPRLVLVGGSGRYCGEPDLAGCDACVAANGSSLREAIATAALRRRSAVWLKAALRVVAPSLDTKVRLKRYFPDIAIEVEAWETATFGPPAAKATVSGTIRVAVIGAIGVQKGYRVLLGCARNAAERLLPMEFVVIGYTVDDTEWLSVGNTFVTGRFDGADIDALIQREAPDVALFASVSPETHCFSLTHALAARLPVVAFDLGAIAERLRAQDVGATLLPFDSGPVAINEALLSAVLRTHGGPPPRRNALIGLRNAGSEKAQHRLPAEVGTEPSGSGVMATTSNGLTASPQLLTLDRGIYSFSVKSAAPRRTTSGANLMLPALHVALAPGVPPEHAEILSGLRADGAWLYDPSDMVLAKVKVAGSSILVTSYSMPGLAPLSIEIEQVDARSGDPDRIADSSTLQRTPPPMRLPPSAGSGPAAGSPPRYAADGRRRVALNIDAHISMIGDITFSDTDWVGAIAEGLPLEALRVSSLERLADDDIEYQGLTVKGAATRWCSGGDLCGSKGQAAALVGLAFRLRGRAASLFECHYTARFGSGAVVGPLTQGVPARGRGPDDFVVGFQLVIVETSPSQRALADTSELTDDRTSPPIGPRFSTFRQEIR